MWVKTIQTIHFYCLFLLHWIIDFIPTQLLFIKWATFYLWSLQNLWLFLIFSIFLSADLGKIIGDGGKKMKPKSNLVAPSVKVVWPYVKSALDSIQLKYKVLVTWILEAGKTERMSGTDIDMDIPRSISFLMLLKYQERVFNKNNSTWFDCSFSSPCGCFHQICARHIKHISPFSETCRFLSICDGESTPSRGLGITISSWHHQHPTFSNKLLQTFCNDFINVFLYSYIKKEIGPNCDPKIWSHIGKNYKCLRFQDKFEFSEVFPNFTR